MSSQIDFAIAVGLFITFFAILLVYLSNFFGGYSGLLLSSELRTAGNDLFNTFFGGKGKPTNWEDYNLSPVRLGLITDLYRLPIKINEANNTVRSNISVNVTIYFDSSCTKKAWNNTIRVYDSSNVLIPVQLYNQTFCSGQFLNFSDVIFNATFSAYQSKTFFIYYSDDKNVSGSAYSLPFTGAFNMTSLIYPEEKLHAVSIAKMNSLRNLTYNELIQSIGRDYAFDIEISQ